ncbi:expressed unknown protein [Seminavis robusta]|uniref:Uncharacterized protein n=1 Tax=Seminavis robusta TaxID=568900 RepID=A0A9N8F0P1_9STRA|nr:expressed unknown protein [Seminavis robusta]|eukprot:Sro2640_g333390.1 n/a (117) ;mRNA; r:1068-1418
MKVFYKYRATVLFPLAITAVLALSCHPGATALDIVALHPTTNYTMSVSETTKNQVLKVLSTTSMKSTQQHAYTSTAAKRKPKTTRKDDGDHKISSSKATGLFYLAGFFGFLLFITA